MKLTIDPRMELLTALEFLSGFTNPGFASLTKLEPAYKKKFLEHFLPYADSKAIKRYIKMCRGGFPLNISAKAIFNLSKPPGLKALHPFSQDKDYFEEFARVAKEFSDETEFAEFFKSNEKIFAEVERAAMAEIKVKDVVPPLEDYYGMGLNSYTVLLTPLFREGGNGFRIMNADKGYDGYAIIGPTEVRGSMPYFGSPQVRTLWHEFSHHLVEPIRENMSSILKPKFSRFKFSVWGYAGWENIVDEYVIRAVCNRIDARKNDEERVLRWMKDEEKGGFTCMTSLYRSLEAYESDREKYPTFADFYLGLTEKLEELLNKQQE